MNFPSQHQPWTDMAVFEDWDASKVAEMLLTNQGFVARTYDDQLVRRLLFLRPPRKTFRLQVQPSDFNRAQDLLPARPTDSLRDAIHCPDCSSVRVSYPQMTRKFIMPTIVLHLGILFRLMDHQCYCEKCHCMWSLPSEASDLAPKVGRDAWPNPS